MNGIVYKELIRFLKQKSRFFQHLYDLFYGCLFFLLVLKQFWDFAIIPPYETYITYETYIVPGLVGMVLLFNGMQSSLTMIFDREMGSMKILLTSYINRNYLLFCKMFATSIVSIVSSNNIFIDCKIYGVDISIYNIVLTIPIIMISSIILNVCSFYLFSYKTI